ncbi:MAG: hypothetical protein OXF23_04240, partial [Candidatus Dadabacteria bacterium]|nr:hypothetical protein [Candidatus Dadabacteria bacterium]
RVFGSARVFGAARVTGNAHVFGEARVADNAHVCGCSRVCGEAQVFGTAKIDGATVERWRVLPVTDPRGYTAYAARNESGEWMIRAGCRAFSIENARVHWGESYAGARWIGDQYLAGLDWLLAQEEQTVIKKAE